MLRTSDNPIATDQARLRKAITGHDRFPDDEFERVKYSMAIISHELAARKGDSPRRYPPIRLYLFTNNIIEMRYLWTAAMVFGMRLKSMQFKQKDIECCEKSEKKSVHNQEHYFFDGYCYPSDPFNYSDQLGWFSRFSNESLYETVFKDLLTDDMLNLPQVSLVQINFLQNRSYHDWRYRRNNEIKTIMVRGEPDHAPLIYLIGRASYIKDFNLLKIFNTGFGLPHDGYLSLAKILVDDAIANGQTYDDHRGYGYSIHTWANGDHLFGPLFLAIALYCWHIDLKCDISIAKHGEKIVSTKSQLSRYIDRVREKEMRPGLFSESEINNFKELISPLNEKYRIQYEPIYKKDLQEKRRKDEAFKKQQKEVSGAVGEKWRLAAIARKETNPPLHTDTLAPVKTANDTPRPELKKLAAETESQASQNYTKTTLQRRAGADKPTGVVTTQREQTTIKQHPQGSNTLFNQPIKPPLTESKRIVTEGLKQQEQQRNLESARALKQQEQKRLQEIEMERVRAIERAKQEEKELKERIEKYQNLMGL